MSPFFILFSLSLTVFHFLWPTVNHLHLDAGVSVQWLVQYATYLDDCYIYTGSPTSAIPTNAMKFFAPGTAPASWSLVATLRAQAKDVAEFDAALVTNIVSCD